MALRFVVLCCAVGLVAGSAIPMWEYLTKDEKMAYLYNMFANQVDEYCTESGMKDCNTELLKHGLKNLHGMPEDHLDVMDPYQRGANTLIWESMMEGHQMMDKKKVSTTTQNSRDAYDDFQESNYLGSASNRHETVLNLENPNPRRPISRFVIVAAKTPKAPVGVAAKRFHYGPMIVKVHPDGRPVQEEKHMPVDDDHHHYMMMKKKVPSLHSFNSSPYAVYMRPNRR